MSFLDILKQFSPLNEEEQEVPMAPSVPERSPQSSAPIIQELPSEGTQELDAGILEQYAQPREVKVVAPTLKLPEIDTEAQAAKEAKFETSLEELRNRYDQSRDDARKRQMYAEMIAAIGNNAGNFTAGQAALASGASVQAPKTAQIDVGDLVAGVDKRFGKDYDNLLKQYKGLKDGGLSTKDKAFLQMNYDQMQMRADSINNNMENSDLNRGIRVKTAQLKDQKDNELSDKQTETISGFGKTDALLADIETRIASGKFDKFIGPYASQIENMKEYNPLSKGMDTEFAKFQSDVTDTLSQYIKSLSGLTVSDKEREALLTSAPKVGDKPQTFAAKLQATRKRLQQYEAKEKEAIAKYQGKNVKGYRQPAPTSSGTIKIMGPSGQVAEVKADVAEKYLSKPGYKKVD